MLPQLAHELLVEILGYLSASDILISSRLVCERLYQASKDRSLWLGLLARSDHVFPKIDVASIPTDMLEMTLLNADKTKDVWTGKRPPLKNEPEVSRDLGANSEVFVGLMGKYFVVHHLKERAKWSWYDTACMRHPGFQAPAFQFAPELKRSFQEIHIWSSVIATDSGTFNAVYTQTDSLADVEEHYLKIVSITNLPNDRFNVQGTVSYPLNPGPFFRAISVREDDQHCPLEMTAGYGYVAVYSSLVAPSESIHVFDFRTGEVIYCPWWRGEHTDEIDYFLTDLQFTPWNQMIQLRPGGILEFFQLPALAERLNTDDQRLRAHKTHVFTLHPLRCDSFTLLSRSPTSCYLFVHCGLEPPAVAHFSLIEMDLVSTKLTTIYTYSLGNLGTWFHKIPFTCPSSTSCLGVAICGTSVGQGQVLYEIKGVYIDFNRALEGEGITVVDLDTHPPDGTRQSLCQFDLDPLAGRVVRMMINPGASSRVLIARDYAVSCPSNT